jgi:hypothetical protein
MIRRFNYTKRKKIPRHRIHLVTSTAPRHQVQSVSWQLGDLGFADEASVYLEATSSGTPAVVRMPWGTVREGRPPEAHLRSLEDLSGESVFFDFKVVDENQETGLILGLARHVRATGVGDAQDDLGSSALLPVNPVDLGEEIWRIDFASGRPYLEVNKTIPGIMDIVRSDAQFFGLVYPEAVRKILLHILVIEDVREPDPSGDWRGQWLAWGCVWHPDSAQPPQGDDGSAREDCLKWTDEVVIGFATERRARQAFEMARGIGDPS